MIGHSMLLGKLQHLVSSKKSRFTTLFTYVFLNKFIASLTSKQTSGLSKQHPTNSKTKAFIEKSWQLTIVLIALLSLSSLSYAELSSVIITDQTAISGEISAAKPPEVLTQKTTLKTRWNTIESSGKNHSVYFHAWGGDPQINSYIQWLAKRVKQLHNIDLHHVKLTDTSEAVSRVLAEKSAENHQQGQVDLVWINGENFASMAQYQLLAKDWVENSW